MGGRCHLAFTPRRVEQGPTVLTTSRPPDLETLALDHALASDQPPPIGAARAAMTTAIHLLRDARPYQAGLYLRMAASLTRLSHSLGDTATPTKCTDNLHVFSRAGPTASPRPTSGPTPDSPPAPTHRSV